MQGKVVLITGGAKRVGAAIGRLLHASGANLMIHYRSSADEARALQDELNAIRPDSVALIQADLLDVNGLPSLVNQTVATFGGLDVLVNNASSFYPTPVGSITMKDWDNLMGSNLMAPLFLSQAAAPELKKRRGCIVNIADIHAERPMKSYVVYSVAKAGRVERRFHVARERNPAARVFDLAPQVGGYALAVGEGVRAWSRQHAADDFGDNAEWLDNPESSDYKGEPRCKAKSY